ncbi:hypothetical protein DV736_g1065, partial [Chaetothyriales sp. CBS 134916]
MALLNLYETPTALPPIGDGPPSFSTVSKSLNVKLVAADNTSKTLGEALASTEREKVLVILIRHFYCSSCQEYVRQISKSLGPEKLARRDMSIIIIGCGAPSLITWYVKVTQCAYPIYADPKTRLYELLGTYRTVSMRTRRLSYVHYSLFMGGLSASQSRGYPEKKDLLAEMDAHCDKKYGDWKIWWCHRMRNARDHTEVVELKERMGLSGGYGGDDDDEIEESHYENGAHADVLQGSRETTGKLHASALRQSKQSWMKMLNSTSRKRKQTKVVTGNGSWEKTKQ